MDLYNRFKSFLGFPNSSSSETFNSDRSFRRPNFGEENEREHPSERPPDEYEKFGFNIFSNPLEMHQYFERQMNEIIKNFGVFGGNDSFFGNSIFGGNGEPFFDDNSFNNDISQFPGIEDFHGQMQDEPSGSLRDQYLKSGYEQERTTGESKSDKDLDGKFDMGDLDSVLKGTPSQFKPRTFHFGQSVTSKIIRNGDGTIETHKTVRDQHGNEETIITRRKGDKEYSITTRTDKEGRQEVIENLVNMDEKDKETFLKRNRPFNKVPDGNEKHPANWFPFDKFFK